jgi:hypothetical protein
MNWDKVVQAYEMLHEKVKTAQVNPDGVAYLTESEAHELLQAMDQCVDNSIPHAHEVRQARENHSNRFFHQPVRRQD